nr:hypothetical protein [Pradoshia eiseniae]
MIIGFSPFVILRWRNDQRFFNIGNGGMFALVERGLPNGTRLSIGINASQKNGTNKAKYELRKRTHYRKLQLNTARVSVPTSSSLMTLSQPP